MCQDVFGISAAEIYKRVAFTNAYYGGRTPRGTRIVFVNGKRDNLFFLRCFSGTLQYNIIQYDAMQCSTIRNDTKRFGTIQSNTIQYSTIRYSTMLRNTIQCNSIHCSYAIQYNAIYCNTVQYDAMIQTIQISQYSTMLTLQLNSMQCNDCTAIKYNTVQDITLYYNTIRKYEFYLKHFSSRSMLKSLCLNMKLYKGCTQNV